MKFKFFKTKEKVEKKENPVGPSLVPMGMQSIGGAKEGAELIKDGYARNVIVYRAVREIATAAASYKYDLHKGKKVLDKHPLIDLLARPNPMNGQGSFIEEIFTNYLITGEMWMSKNGTMASKAPKELWSLTPLEMRVIPGNAGIPLKYVHKRGNIETPFNVDAISGMSDVFFLKMYDPLNYWRGMPPLRAAALAADAHNEGLNWNYNLMKKGARPSGYVKGTGSAPGADIIGRIKEWYRNNVQGSDNAGEVLITFGGAEYVPFEQNAKDMDFIQGMKEFAKYVSTAFGVPIPLIDNDAATMNNMEQSKERLHTDTVLPLTDRFLDGFNAWIRWLYDDPELTLKVDLDCIPALEGLRQKKFDRTVKLKDSGMLTINEAREEVGFEKYPDPNADKLFVNGGLVPLETADVGYDPTEAAPAEDPMPTDNPPVKSQEPINQIFHVHMPEMKSQAINIPPPVINFSPEFRPHFNPQIKTPETVVNVPAPVINFNPEIKTEAPIVNVAAPVINVDLKKPIKVQLAARKKEMVVTHDSDGNILKTIQVETDL